MEEILSGKADLHIHSEYSHDAHHPIEKILKTAKSRGLDIVAITDHNVIAGSKRAEKIAQDFGLAAIVGEEIDTKDGDIIAVFIKDFIAPGRSAMDTIREIHKQGGLAIIPHPFNWVVGGLKEKAVFEIFPEADGIEVFNGGWCGSLGRKRAHYLNLTKFNLAQIASSDSHLACHVGRAFVSFKGKTPGDLFLAIKNKETRPAGKSWTTTDRLAWLGKLPNLIAKEIVYRTRKNK